MKKILMMAALVVASVSASAQVWVGGALSYDFDKTAGFKTNTITIAPEVGYNLSDKWAIAIDVDYSVGFGDGATTHTFDITPYARYTFFKSGIASFFVDGGFNIGADKVGAASAQTTWGIGFQPGISLALSPKFNFVTKLGYLGYQHREATNSDQFGLGVNNRILSVGLYYNF